MGKHPSEKNSLLTSINKKDHQRLRLFWYRIVITVLILLLTCGAFLIKDFRSRLASAKMPGIVASGKGLLSEDIPDYSGIPYITVDNNMPSFDISETQWDSPVEYYSNLDSLGRCGPAFANLCKELEPTEERGDISEIHPSGWNNQLYDGIDQEYLYNRCHLIGFQLAGENDNERNLITGTRYFNVEGMLPFENRIHQYIDTTENHVLYRVTPLFEGKNLLADGVQIEAWSVEDNGLGICLNVFVYNVQPGIAIDYSNGNSHLVQ